MCSAARSSAEGREATVRPLIRHGANPNLKDKDGWTSLHMTALKQYEEVVQVLLK